jgi:hypothetical protein
MVKLNPLSSRWIPEARQQGLPLLRKEKPERKLLLGAIFNIEVRRSRRGLSNGEG